MVDCSYHKRKGNRYEPMLQIIQVHIPNRDGCYPKPRDSSHFLFDRNTAFIRGFMVFPYLSTTAQERGRQYQAPKTWPTEKRTLADVEKG